jgi:hypothetical protein
MLKATIKKPYIKTEAIRQSILKSHQSELETIMARYLNNSRSKENTLGRLNELEARLQALCPTSS